MPRTWFITGASSGFGRVLAEEVLKSGDHVVLAARRYARLQEVVSEYGSSKALAVELDVLSPESRTAAISKATSTFGHIDVLVNNAGAASFGAVEEFSDDELRRQMELNFFAPVALTKEVLPLMRAQQSGHIVNFSSIGGLTPFPGCGPYCCSKYSLECWTETLAREVSHLGIKVMIVEPGAFPTELVGAFIYAKNHIDAYEPALNPIREWMQNMENTGDVRKAMKVTVDAVNAGNSAPLRLMLGSDAFALYDREMEARGKDIQSWRTRGEDTKINA